MQGCVARLALAAVAILTLSGCLRPSRDSKSTSAGPSSFDLKAAEALTPLACSGCHPKQYAEWRTSIMAYSTTSPSYHAMEVMGNVALDGRFRRRDQSFLFCIECHSVQSNKLLDVPEYKSGDEIKPHSAYVTDVTRHGVSCDGCHQAILQKDIPDHIQGDDRIEFFPFDWAPRPARVGPLESSVASKFHLNAKDGVMSKSEFCEPCHQVHIAGKDPVTGEDFKRLQNAYEEWKASPWSGANNPTGKRQECQDCHMSQFPYKPMGTYATGKAAIDGGARWSVPERKLTSHYFTGVDVPIVDFPDVDNPTLDDGGVPKGTKQRRADMLRATVKFEAKSIPATITKGATLPLRYQLTNVGAGHRFPSGFSKLRELWINLVVRDSSGKVLYESGFLRDKPHPETGEATSDGRLNDEDLEEFVWTIDQDTLRTKEFGSGPDANQRPKKNLGLVNFRDRLLSFRANETIEEIIPYFAAAVANDRGLKPLEPYEAAYDIPIPADAVSPLRVEARLLFRAFVPLFLRGLGARTGLIDEDMVDRNDVVEMGVEVGQVSID